MTKLKLGNANGKALTLENSDDAFEDVTITYTSQTRIGLMPILINLRCKGKQKC